MTLEELKHAVEIYLLGLLARGIYHLALLQVGMLRIVREAEYLQQTEKP
jgi:hypothetical protein